MYIFLFGAKIWPKTGWGKKVDKKGGKIHIFSLIGKKYAYYFPNRLKICKIANEKAENFRLRHAPPHCNQFQLAKKCKSRRGGGQKYEFQI